MPENRSRSWLRIQWRLHRLIWSLSGGRWGNRVIGMPVLELETTGHKSGQPRSVLITYIAMSSTPVVAGTNAGEDHDPAWIRNLRADPVARVRQSGRWRDVHARFLQDEEWERAWNGFVEYVGYADYRRMTDRPIPLVALESPA